MLNVCAQLKVVAATVLLVASCGSDPIQGTQPSADASVPSTFEEGPVVGLLRACGFVSEGIVPGRFISIRDEDVSECVLDCFRRSSCEELAEWYCGEDGSSLNQCLTVCTRYRCAGGTSERPMEWVCDGIVDCPQGDDEARCEGPTGYMCNDGTVVRSTSRCNGLDTCPDGEDEVDCPAEPVPPVFLCDDGRPVPYAFVCDEDPDCSGGEDEENCSTIIVECDGS